jgi:hypothetical protein
MHRVSPRTQAFVRRLKVKAGIEIEGGAIFFKLGTYPRAVRHDEVDPAGSGEQGSLDCTCGYAFGPLRLQPFELGHQRMGLHRNPKYHFILDDEARDGLADGSWLRGKDTEQQWHEIP